MANNTVSVPEKIISQEELKKEFVRVLHDDFQTTPSDADDREIYEALTKIT